MNPAPPPAGSPPLVLRGILFFLASQACLVFDSIAVHHLGPAVDVQQLTLARGCGSLLLLLAFLLLRREGLAVFQTARPGLQILRGALTVIPLWFIFWGLARIPLADATALTFTLPVWMVLLGAVLLRERVQKLRWAATILGFAGALIVTGPGFLAWDWAYLAILIGVALNAGGAVATRALARQDGSVTIFAWITLVGLVLSLPGFFGPVPTLGQWPAILMVAAAGTGAVWFGLLALRVCDVSALAPYGYARLPIAVLFGIMLFGEMPTAATLIGSSLILLAGILPLLPSRATKRSGAPPC